MAKKSESSEPSQTQKLGQRLEQLGKELQKPDPLITDLVRMAGEVGWQIDLSVDKRSAKVVNLREECYRLIIAEKELQEQRIKAEYELSLIKSLTGLVSASYEKEDGGTCRLNVHWISGAPYGPTPIPIHSEL